MREARAIVVDRQTLVCAGMVAKVTADADARPSPPIPFPGVGRTRATKAARLSFLHGGRARHTVAAGAEAKCCRGRPTIVRPAHPNAPVGADHAAGA
jgi:hypothetical protein